MMSTRTSRSARAVLVLTALLMLAGQGVASAAVAIGGLENHSLTEQDDAILAAPSATITGGTAYDGEYMDISIGSAQDEEILSLQTVETADITDGVVSVVGSSIYLGDGTTAAALASIDPTFNGTDGQKLRINFSSDFSNAGFEADGGSTTGWTLIEQVVDLGVTELAGFTTVDTADYPGASGGNDDDYPGSPGNFSVTADDSTASQGSYSMRLASTGMTTLNGCDVVHGPAAVSGGFEAAAGDEIYFDWRAFSGGDAYHVFGYIIDADGNQTEVLDTYSNSSSNTDWATKATTIPANGTYKFVFVSGTYDASCGRAAGAALHIDNVRVFGSKVNDAVVQQITRLLTYENQSDAPEASRTVTIEAFSQAEGSASETFDITIGEVHDAPSFPTPDPATFINLEGDDPFAPLTGTVSGVDPDEDAETYDLTDSGAETGSWEFGGVTYDQRVVGAWSTFYLESSTGKYRAEVNDATAEGFETTTRESFEVAMTVDGVTVDTDIDIEVKVETPPGTPVLNTIASGIDSVELDWTAPTWAGGAAITDYLVRYSTDGISWTTFADGVGTGTSATVTGLTPGVEYRFKIEAVNANGTSAGSAIKKTTPRTEQTPLTVSAERFSTGSSTVPTVTGGSGTGAVSYTVVSGPCEVVDGAITSTAAGVCRIVATKAGDSTYVDEVAAAIEIVVGYGPAPCLSMEWSVDAATVFDDVETGRYYSDATSWAYHNEIALGRGPATMAPYDSMTRAELVTLAYRMFCEPDVDTAAPFDDLTDGAFYRTALDWAYDTGVIRGRTADTFAPEAPVTRGELATILHRLAQLPTPDAGVEYTDVEADKFYAAATAWMGATGLTSASGEYDPDSSTSRAEALTMLYRLNTRDLY